MYLTQAEQVCKKYGCTDDNLLDVLNRWNEPHRVYHNTQHLIEILHLIGEANTLASKRKELLVLIAMFHDVIYNPSSSTNELDSAELFAKYCPNVSTLEREIIYNAILDTKDHTNSPSHPISAEFLRYDLNGLLFGNITRMISDEKKIMREFGFVDFHTYKKVRGEKFLEKYIPWIKRVNPASQADAYFEWYKSHQPKIAVFAGTFFPFHKGHYDVLLKAEKTFDKVIVLMGVNPAKKKHIATRLTYRDQLQKLLPNNQVEFYEGMLHEFIKQLNYPVTIVKGLRNPSDFDSEKLQLRYMEDLYPEINIVYIVSDRKYEHLSSSSISIIESEGQPGEAAKYLLE